AALLFGMFPALAMSSEGIYSALRSGGRGLSGDRRRSQMRNALIVTEVALALVLLTGAGLLGRSLWSLYSVDPGFRADGTIVTRVALTSERYQDEHRQVAFARDLGERLKKLPGVKAAGAVSSIPVGG